MPVPYTWLPWCIRMILQVSNPIVSMYGIFSYIYQKNQPNVGMYTIHGSYGNGNGNVDHSTKKLHTSGSLGSGSGAACRLQGGPKSERRIQSYLDLPDLCVKFGAEIHQKKPTKWQIFHMSRRCRYSKMMIGQLNHLSIMLRFRETIPRKMIGCLGIWKLDEWRPKPWKKARHLF